MKTVNENALVNFVLKNILSKGSKVASKAASKGKGSAKALDGDIIPPVKKAAPKPSAAGIDDAAAKAKDVTPKTKALPGPAASSASSAAPKTGRVGTSALGAVAATTVAADLSSSSSKSPNAPTSSSTERKDKFDNMKAQQSSSAGSANKPANTSADNKDKFTNMKAQQSAAKPAEPERKSFSQAFKDAREKAGGSGGKFKWTDNKGNTKEYQTNIKGEKYSSPSKLRDVSSVSSNPTPTIKAPIPQERPVPVPSPRPEASINKPSNKIETKK